MLPSEEEDFLDTRLVTQLNGGYHRNNGLGNGHHSNSDSNVTGVGRVSRIWREIIDINYPNLNWHVGGFGGAACLIIFIHEVMPQIETLLQGVD